MPDSIYDLPPDVGQTLFELRKATGKNQDEIARSLNTDQARISKIENGKLIPLEGEIEGYLSVIGTDAARDYLAFLKQPWKRLERPSFWHPQREELCKAETSLQKLEDFKSQPNVSKQQINEAELLYGKPLLSHAKYLSHVNHSIAFLGRNAVGKTTAVSKLTGLVNSQESTFHRQSLLATNISKTTACEVHIQDGEKYGIRVYPQSEDEINKVIEDFWAVWKNSSEEERENQRTDVAWEIERALSNMIKLAGEDSESEEPLIELLDQCEDLATFQAEIFDRLKLFKLSERKRREIWFEDTSEQTNREELKKKFKDINYSLDKELPLPQRLDVIVPNKIFHSSPYKLEIIDTRGVAAEGAAKEIVNRQDLLDYLKDERNLTVLCCKFGDAPGEVINSFIESHIKTREKVFKEQVLILVLAHDKDAFKTTNNAGDYLDKEEDAYKLEQNQVQKLLRKLQQKQKCSEVLDIPILFFNASSDEPVNAPERINTALIQRVEKLREPYIQGLIDAVNGLDLLIKDVEDKNAREAHTKVIKSIKGFLEAYPNLPQRSWSVHQALLDEMEKAHPRKVLATTRRRGISDSFNVYVILGNEARDIAWHRSNKVFHELIGIINEKLRDSELAPAHTFLKQLLANWSVWREDFLKYAEQNAKQVFQSQLRDYFNWAECVYEYGKGGNFRKKVKEKLEQWFDAPEQKHLHIHFKTRLEKAWQERVLNQLEDLTDDSVEVEKTTLSKG